MSSHQKRGRRVYRMSVPEGERYQARSVTMTDAMWEALDVIAREQDTTRSAIIRRLVRDELDRAL